MSKYRAKKCRADGFTFDSLGEARRYEHLKRRQILGEIHSLVVHPKYPLVIDGKPVIQRSERYKNGRKVNVYLDFAYIDSKTQERHVEDYKGLDTPVSRLKRALVEAIHGIKVEVVG
jgi:hypothetical protein